MDTFAVHYFLLLTLVAFSSIILHVRSETNINVPPIEETNVLSSISPVTVIDVIQNDESKIKELDNRRETESKSSNSSVGTVNVSDDTATNNANSDVLGGGTSNNNETILKVTEENNGFQTTNITTNETIQAELNVVNVTTQDIPQFEIDANSISVIDGIQYYNISNKAESRSNMSDHRPKIKQRTNEGNPSVNKFTIQDTFDILKDFEDQEDTDISKLTKYVMKHYLSKCIIIFLYDEIFYASVTLRSVITDILEYSPLPVMHGMINTSGLTYHTSNLLLDPPERKCRNFIILTKNLENSAELMGRQRDSRIVFIAYMSSYLIKQFLSESLSHNLLNLLIIADPNLQHDEFNKKSEFYSIDMYTHRLHMDSLGTSIPWVLTSWRHGNMTRPWVNLFPNKLTTGFHGHRFLVSVAQNPPYIFRRQKFEHDSSGKVIQTETNEWDGLELKILKHMSQYLNMTLELFETSSSNPGDGGPGRVIYDIVQERAAIGIAGMVITNDRLLNVSFSAAHSQDCAVFMSLTSLALSKYRAIFGPFRWEVWVCVVLVYLLAIVPPLLL
ncbi:hypothetical protein WDU94_004321 [Cyamophila willieti]